MYSLPDKFVIKASHGSKITIVVDKAADSFDYVDSKVEAWMLKDYSKSGRERMYKNLSKYLLIEEKPEIDGDVPPDFKFSVLNGCVGFVQLDLARFSSHRRNLYSPDFKKLNANLAYPNTDDISSHCLMKKH